MWLTGEFQEAMAALWQLRRDNDRLLRSLAADGPIINKTVAWVVNELLLETIEAAPVLTGTLASAHRGIAVGNEGLLFVDPNVQNPVFGGFPALYGEEVHEIGAFGGMARAKPWWRETFEDRGDAILAEGMLMLEADIADLWKQ